MLCDSDVKGSNCKVTNIGYNIICKLCKLRKITKSYEGETGRNAYIRGREHNKDFEKKNENSIMLKHILSDHKEEEEQVTFEMKIVGRFKDPMNRQIDEAIRINNREPKTLLNSKSEFHGPSVKRKVLENRRTSPGNT